MSSKEELIAIAERDGVPIDRRWSVERIRDAIMGADMQNEDEPPEVDRIEAMNAYARRIWDGQSIDLYINERVERIKAGLIAQGFEDVLKELRLPTKEDYQRYL